MEHLEKPRDRAWAGSISRLRGASSVGVWDVVLDAYYWDRVEQAHELALELGVASVWQEWMYRLIEAEAVTREASQTIELEDQISIECVNEEFEDASFLSESVSGACREVRDRFGWTEPAPTLVTILAGHTDAQWRVGRDGYMMDKFPFDKICIPFGATSQSRILEGVVRHEYTHVMVLNLSEGRAPIHLHEAVTMVAEDHRREQDWSLFVSGEQPWLSAHELNSAFDDKHDPSRFHRRSLAYSQSSALGFYLKSLGGEHQMAQLLRAFANNSNWVELKMNLTGQLPADEALREVYGFGEKALFDKTHEWLRSQV